MVAENYWAIFAVEPNTLVIRNPKTGRYSIVGGFSGRGYGDHYTWAANKDSCTRFARRIHDAWSSLECLKPQTCYLGHP